MLQVEEYRYPCSLFIVSRTGDYNQRSDGRNKGI